MKYALLAGLAFTSISLSAAYAAEAPAAEARQQHFKVLEPKNWDEAMAILKDKGAEMKAAYAKQDYAAMHELSYHLEVAADVLKEESEKLLESVEKVHHTTEDGETEKLNQAFPQFKIQLQKVTGVK